ncbi:MAG: T9SS type A sorting domain-containing protein [Bacteroidota bacterium]
MRKIMVVFLIMILAKGLVGQNYIPLPMDSAIWCSTYGCSLPNPGWCDRNYQYSTAGDTIINLLHYTKIHRTESGMFPCGCYSNFGAIRQDTLARKVYVRMDSTDTILYDFSQQIGDTVHSVIFNYLCSSEIIKVVKIDSVLIDTVFHRRLALKGNICLADTMYFIEGIGGSGGLFEMANGFEWGGTLICVSHYNQKIYQSQLYECPIIIGIYENKPDAIIKVYPNPTEDKITLENPSIIKDKSITIYNLQGQLLMQQTAKEGKIEIDVSGLLKGMYFVRVETDEGMICGKFVKE